MKKNFFLFLFLFVVNVNMFSSINIYDLHCEQMSEPICIDRQNPAFSWKLYSSRRNFKQRYYRIIVSKDSMMLVGKKGDIWDSGKIKSDNSVMVLYDGKRLEPATKYYWRVYVDSNGKEKGWSEISDFSTALYDSEDWNGAKWIGLEADKKRLVPAVTSVSGTERIGQYKMPLLRKVFNSKYEIESATAFVSGLGHFDFFVNGNKVGNSFLDPGWTKYDKEVRYVAFDITSMLNNGKNVFGVMLGNGFYNVPNERYYKLTGSYGAPKLMFCLKVKYRNGYTESIISDGSWKVNSGPITFSSIYGGEDYNAMLCPENWKNIGFDDDLWSSPVVYDDMDVVLKAQQETSVKIRDVLPVVKVYRNSDNSWIYDFGQNFSGIIRLKVKGKKGDTVVLRPGELLNPDSTVNQSASGGPYYFKYTIGKDDTEEIWQPQFSYYGFRYIQVEGAAPYGKNDSGAMPEVISLSGLHTTAALNDAGTFDCSDPLFNKIYNLIDWAVRSNVSSVITDCPHREKLGWLEQIHLMQYSLQYKYNLLGVYRKMLSDIKNSQQEDGMVPSIAPELIRFAGGFENSPEWGSAFIISPWYVYKWYADKRILETYYDDMKLYHDYLTSRADNHIISYGLGDWYDIGPNPPGYAQLTSNGLTATAIYYYDTIIMEKISVLLNKKDDADYFSALSDSIKSAYNERFYNKEKGYYDRNSQTANAISLYLNLVEEENKSKVVGNLLNDIRSRGNSLTAGDIGYLFLLRSLENNNLSDVIYDINSRYDVPGYGWQLANGATALTESWQAYGFVSNNHFMLGHLMEWLFGGLGGLKQSENSVAYSNVLIKPQFVGDIRYAKTSYESPYGRIYTEWQIIDNEHYNLKVEIPANASAMVHTESRNPGHITDYGMPVLDSDDFVIHRSDDGKISLQIGSGIYNFIIKRD